MERLAMAAELGVAARLPGPRRVTPEARHASAHGPCATRRPDPRRACLDPVLRTVRVLAWGHGRRGEPRLHVAQHRLGVVLLCQGPALDVIPERLIQAVCVATASVTMTRPGATPWATIPTRSAAAGGVPVHRGSGVGTAPHAGCVACFSRRSGPRQVSSSPSAFLCPASAHPSGALCTILPDDLSAMRHNTPG